MVVDHVNSRGYEKIAAVGFSLGANVLLKYLGEQHFKKPDTLRGGVAVSAPCDLGAWSDCFHGSQTCSLLTKTFKQPDLFRP